MNSTIKCPRCQNAIEITEVMSAQLSTEIRSQMEAELAPERVRLTELESRLTGDRTAIEMQREAVAKERQTIDTQVRERLASEREKLIEQARVKATEDLAVELRDRDEKLKEVQAKLKKADDQEVALRKRERDLLAEREAIAKEKEGIAEQTKKQIASEREKLIAEGRKKASDELALTIKAQEDELAESKQRLESARQAELELRKKERELLQKAEEMELTVNRRLGEERDRVRTEALKQAADEQRLKDAEKEKKISDLVKQIDEMKRKAEQGSQQTQGEVLELELENLLRDSFQSDRIDEVPKGVRGADLIQRVISSAGLECGSIIWETKRAKSWKGEWLAKLRQDQREAKAELAVLVSDVLPAGVTHFDLLDGVYICSRACVKQVAALLREGLVEASKARRALEGQHGKMEQVYNYLASPAFKNRVAGMLEPLVRMKADLATEKRAIQTHWAKREKQIDQAILGASGWHGDLQGIIGGAMPVFEALDIHQLEATNEIPALSVEHVGLDSVVISQGQQGI